MIAMAPTIRPPAPRPCSPRKAMSSAMLCDWPASAEPTRNTAMDAMNTPRRPNRSPSLAHTGVDAAVANV